MVSSHTKAEILAHNRESLQRLERAVRLSMGQFSVVLVRCDYERLQGYVIEQLQSQFDGVQVLALEANTPSVVMAIRHHLQTATTPPTALVITQLWALSNLNQALKDANLARDQLRSLMDCPLILWLSDRVVRLISRYAQDFKNQAPPTIPFDYPTDELIYALHQGTNQLFQQALEFGSDALPETALNLNGTSRLRNELEAALNDLGPDQPLDPDLTASLDFLRGRDAHSRTEMEAARECYERSLAYWQEQSQKKAEGRNSGASGSPPNSPSPTPLEKTAILHFYLGLWWRSNAVLQRVTYKASLRQAQQHFAACLAIFKVLNQPQRQAQFIHALAEVLQKQRDWRALAAIARESLALHEQTQDWVRQARDRGFLAEVALAYQDWQTARTEALHALDLLTEAEQRLDQNPADEPLAAALAIANRFQRGWYRFLLGEAQMHLGTPQEAIALLAQAQAETNPELDLTLYRQILDELIHHYFEAGQYREAFRIKQERRAVEFRYNLRAFIGAGAVQPHKRSAFARPLDSETQTAVAAEIAASGREQDIKRLVQRLKAKQNQLIVIHGPSGVGKSSIVNAGLTPALRRITPEGRNSLPILIQTYVNWQQAIEAALDQALAKLPTRPTAVRTRLIASPTAINSNPNLEPIPGKLRAFNKFPSTPAPPFLVSPNPPVPELVEGLPHSRSAELTSKPTHSLLAKLQALSQKDYFIVLLFDQFEEFFFERQTLEERRLFYEFLGQCLNRLELSFIKVVLSLREDYLHHLLEVEKVVDLSSSLDQSSDRKDNDILSRDIRYRLDNFSPTDAEAVIRKLTTDAQFYLDDALIAVLVQDLALETGDVRPIELQVVGAQLQREGITTLDQYRDLGETPKQTLVQKFLAYTVADCGPPNEELARIVLYVLTEEDADKRLYRPLKTREEVEEALTGLGMGFEETQLDLVLEILVGSGLVFEVPDEPDDRFQLVHDYLVDYVRLRHPPEILQELAAAKQRQKETEEKLNVALREKAEVLQERLSFQKRATRLSLGLASVALIFGISTFFIAQSRNKQRIRAERSEIQALSSASRTLFLSNNQLEALVASVGAVSALREASLASPDRVRMIGQLWTVLYSIRERNRLEGHGDSVLSVAFSPDGNTLASASADGTVKLWSSQGQELNTLEGHSEGVTSVVFSPDGNTLASASTDGTVKLWSSQGEELNTLEGHGAAVWSVAFSPDGNTLASASTDGTVKLWSSQGEVLQTLEGHSGRVHSVTFSPDGNTLASANADGTVKLWNSQGEVLRTLEGHSGPVWSVTFSPDGNTLASASADDTVKLWSFRGEAVQTLEGHSDWVTNVAFSPDSNTLASASTDDTVKLWRRQGEALKTLEGHGDSVLSVTFSPDGNTLASASGDDTVKLWNLQGEVLQTLEGHSDSVWSVTFSPDGNTLASASGDGTVKLWNLQGEVLQTLEGHNEWVNNVTFSPDGNTLASASADGTVKLWSSQGEVLQTLEGHSSSVVSVTFSPDGNTLASASADGTVKLWSSQGEVLQTLEGHSSSVVSVTFSPDGNTLASASADGTVKLWNSQGEELNTLEGHSDWVNSVAFSPDGNTLASASGDGTVKLWSLQGEVLQTLEGHNEWVNNVTFSPDGNTLASGGGTSIANPDGGDNRIILWNIDLDNALTQACNWLTPYLSYNPNVSDKDRALCPNIN